jgi:Transglycosylase SLT domain/Sel1 repeat
VFRAKTLFLSPKIDNQKAIAVMRILLICAVLSGLLALAAEAVAEPAPTVGTASVSPSFDRAVQYENGEGVAQDYARALHLYCDAANLGDARAFLNLGWMYANGHGVARDSAIAVGWWQKASDAGIPQATNLLQLMSHTAPSANLGCGSLTPDLSKRQAHASPAVLRLVKRIAVAAGLDPALVLAVIATESDFDTRAVSPRNAMGLMQLTPDTASRFGVRDPFNSEQNIRGGTKYLRWLLRRFDGDLTLTLAAYNAGEQRVDSYGGVPPFAETTQYVERIKRLYGVDMNVPVQP